MLSRTEKEQRVIELYQQGKTIREIAQEVHMSFGDIGSIIRKVTGLQHDDDDNKSKEQQQDNKPHTTLSKDSQAFALFSEGKRPIEVAIKLDLGADVIDRLYQQFWKLEGLYQLNMAYKEIRRYLPSFLKLFQIMKQQKMMSEKDVVDALKFGKELPQLKDQFQLLVEEINRFEYKRNSLRTALSALQNQISAAKDSLKIWQSALLEEMIKDYLYHKLVNEKRFSEKEADKEITDIFSYKKQGGKQGLHRVMSINFKQVDGRSIEENSELWTRFNNVRTTRKNVIHPRTTLLKENKARETLVDILVIFGWIFDKNQMR